MKEINLDVIKNLLYFYLPTCWEDFQQHEICNYCSDIILSGTLEDISCNFLHFHDCEFHNVTFINVDFDNIGFVRCTFINCKFKNVHFNLTNIQDCIFIDTTFLVCFFDKTKIISLNSKNEIDLLKCRFSFVDLGEDTYKKMRIKFPKEIEDNKNSLCIRSKILGKLSINEYKKLL